MKLVADDLVKIIDACAKARVKTFKSPEFEISFGDQVEVTESVMTNYDDMLAGIKVKDAETPPELTPDEIAERAEIENANLLFSDPLAHEQLQMEGEG